MTLEVTIIQKCNGCKATRQLRSEEEAEHGGWRAVSSGKHLCVDCINVALTGGIR